MDMIFFIALVFLVFVKADGNHHWQNVKKNMPILSHSNFNHFNLFKQIIFHENTNEIETRNFLGESYSKIKQETNTSGVSKQNHIELYNLDNTEAKLSRKDKNRGKENKTVNTLSETGNKARSLISNPEPDRTDSKFKPVTTALSVSKKNQMEEFFLPQIPVPVEEVFVAIEPSNNSQKIVNCSSQNTSETCGEALEHAPQFEQATLIKVIILCIIAGFSLIGNTATLYSILKTGRQNTSTVYILLVQLAISDLLVAIFCLFADAIWKITVQFYGGNILCKVVKFMQMFSLYLSTYILVLIGFDRLCAIRFPMSRARAKYYVRNGVIWIWIISAVFSSPQVSLLFPACWC
ncbi:gonadotropin-releasing hormone receptor [Nephila pilipes]|uniref:Gonadotropin-releasing hormone receptor n=1 Tax=Nephila pilipes TaxID=299642 RepID=A0A8X6PBW5_NEPPI|nr:gonadotropin-releasing hormone receptor [Nephila pilipes]